MVRYTLALRGEAKDVTSKVVVKEKEVNIQRGEQLSEEYLCEINPKGQVPVLTGGSLEKPIPDSLDITFYIAELFPDLMPASHKAEITHLLKELHGLNFFSLSYENEQAMTQGVVGAIRQKMEGDISQRYKEALAHKLNLFKESKVGGLESKVVKEMVDRTKTLLERFNALLTLNSLGAGTRHLEDPWLLGTIRPTALDTHVIPFIKRLQDINRENLVPPNLLRWAELTTEKGEWTDLMQGRSTMFRSCTRRQGGWELGTWPRDTALA